MPSRYSGNITTRRVSCRVARRMVRRYQDNSGRVRGFYCRWRIIGWEAGDVRCTGTWGRVVRWQVTGI